MRHANSGAKGRSYQERVCGEGVGRSRNRTDQMRQCRRRRSEEASTQAGKRQRWNGLRWRLSLRDRRRACCRAGNGDGEESRSPAGCGRSGDVQQFPVCFAKSVCARCLATAQSLVLIATRGSVRRSHGARTKLEMMELDSGFGWQVETDDGWESRGGCCRCWRGWLLKRRPFQLRREAQAPATYREKPPSTKRKGKWYLITHAGRGKRGCFLLLSKIGPRPGNAMKLIAIALPAAIAKGTRRFLCLLATETLPMMILKIEQSLTRTLVDGPDHDLYHPRTGSLQHQFCQNQARPHAFHSEEPSICI